MEFSPTIKIQVVGENSNNGIETPTTALKMKEYLFLFRGGDCPDMTNSPEQTQGQMQPWIEWMGNLTKEGKFLGAQALNPSPAAANKLKAVKNIY